MNAIPVLCIVALGVLIIDHVRQEFKAITYRRALEFYANKDHWKWGGIGIEPIGTKIKAGVCFEEWKPDNGRVARITLGYEPEDGKWDRA